MPPTMQGQGVGVAVVDTGISNQNDLKNMVTGGSRVITSTNFITSTTNSSSPSLKCWCCKVQKQLFQA